MEKQKRKPEGQNYFLRFISFIFSGMWQLLLFSLKGLWQLLVFSLKGLWSGISWLFKLPYRLLRYIISGRVPQFENARQEEIFWRIKRQYRRKRFFTLHLMFYFIAILGCIGIGISEYLRVPELILSYPGYNYWESYFRLLLQMGAGLGVWTFLVIFHFIFNRMGNEEDKALGAALEQEYARSSEKLERYERLRDDEYEEEYESYPKQNGSKS